MNINQKIEALIFIFIHAIGTNSYRDRTLVQFHIKGPKAGDIKRISMTPEAIASNPQKLKSWRPIIG